jgi:hypothetical protein
MSEQVQGKMQRDLQHVTNDYSERLHVAGNNVGQGAEQLSRQMARLEQLHRMLVWKVVGVTIACFALLLTGGLWLSIHYAGVIRDNQLSAETLKAYNAADLSLCDGRVCARVDTKGAHYGEHGQYVPVRLR